jgi:hypothetical protein
MKVSIAACGILVSLAALGAIPVNDPRPMPNGGFSVWAQAQRPESCQCTSATTGGVECLPIVRCLELPGRCGNVC